MADDYDQSRIISGKKMTSPFGNEYVDMNGEMIRNDTNILTLDGEDDGLSGGTDLGSEHGSYNDDQGALGRLGNDGERQVICHFYIALHQTLMRLKTLRLFLVIYLSNVVL